MKSLNLIHNEIASHWVKIKEGWRQEWYGIKSYQDWLDLIVLVDIQLKKIVLPDPQYFCENKL